MRSGINEILEDGFGVPSTPTLGQQEAARRVMEKVKSEKVEIQSLDISELPIQRGSLFDMASEKVQFPHGEAYETCYVALVDPSADLQWGHPAWWAFVPSDGAGEVVLQRTDLPENVNGAWRFVRVPLS
jgi:hypothetical protein